ncbi:MAG: MFS transporter [Rubrivivax sp.]|nr:MFS transporter [Rubrivivax sp.]
MSVPAPRVPPALVVILAGVTAALHVGKLAPAIATLQSALGLTLVQAGFLLSLVQGAGMLTGVAFGVVADGLGARRSMVLGLAVLAAASAAGGAVSQVPALMVLRALEGFGFLLAVLPAPGLVRALVAPGRLNATLGLWGAYMPLGTALAMLLGPGVVLLLGWRAWWWVLAAATATMAVVLLRTVPATAVTHAAPAPWRARLARTLAAPGPWLVALTFALYSGQWLAVVGFLPTIYTAAGLPGAVTGVLSALAAAANIVGNIASGRLLQRGVAPRRLFILGFVTMALAATATFAGTPGLPAWARFVAVLLFSGFGGLIPATLFAQAVRVAPGPDTLSTTVGWMQQWSSFGQFAGPPLVAAVASAAGGWQATWWVTGASSVAGLALALLLTRPAR